MLAIFETHMLCKLDVKSGRCVADRTELVMELKL